MNRPKYDIAEREPNVSLNLQQAAESDGAGEGEEANPLDDNDDLQKAVLGAIRKHSDSGKTNDMPAVGSARDKRLYMKGIQRTFWNEDAQDVGFLSRGDADYQKTFNIVQAYAKIFISTFMGASPKVEPEADNPMDPDSIHDTSKAQDYERIWRKNNDMATLQMEIGRLLFTDGRILTLTENGVSDDGTPGQYTRLYGMLEARVPGYQRKVKDWPIFQTEQDLPLVMMKRTYGIDEDGNRNALWKKLNSGAGDSYYRNARLAVKRMGGNDTTVDIYTGEDVTGLCTETRSYLRPDFYEHFNESERKEMEDAFPTGCCIIHNGDTYLKSMPFDMDASVDVFYAIPSDGALSPGIVDPLMNVQDSVNVALNLTEDIFDHGIPTTYAAQETNIATLNQNRVEPGGTGVIQLSSGRTAEQHFYSTPELQPSQALSNYIEQMQGPFAQFVTGLPPAIQGFGDQDQKTASGYAQMRQMALGQMAIVWKPFTSWYTREMTRCVKLAAAGQDPIASTLDPLIPGGKRRNVTIEPREIAGFRFTNSSDENFPQTWTERRNAFMQIMQDPDTKAWIMQEPDNLYQAQKYLDLHELKIPGVDSRLKQLNEIAEMKTGPIPDPSQMPAQPMPAVGQPPIQPPLVTSVPVVKYDVDEIEQKECLDWINSPTGQEAKVAQPAWYQNVCLHCDAHEAQMAQKAAANAPPPVPPPPPNVAINFADLPPVGQVQAAAQHGINIPQPPPMPIGAP